ncbi:MAG: DNA polymerase IV [Christensenellaceae bacterium]|nr:DNA polymerase IV [Christensenellaceae bacterium]
MEAAETMGETDMGRTILHVDMNNFYASVEIRDNPALGAYPLAVGGSEAMRHGIILAKNYKAKAFGIKTAEPIFEAKRKCPNLVVVPPHFERYEEASRLSRELLSTYSDRVEPFGMDEAWIDISEYAPTPEAGEEIADEIREKYKKHLGLTVSIGVSFNKVFAKLGSDMKKPDATTVITEENFRTKVWRLPVEDLLFVGRKTKEKLNKRGVMTIGDLANANERLLHAWLGEGGDMLHRYANGLDSSQVMAKGSEAAIKSIGNSSTPPRDMYDERDALTLLQALSETVAERLRRHKLLATTVVLHLRDNSLISFERQMRLLRPSCVSVELRDSAMQLLRENWDWRRPIRSLGVRATGLISADSPMQLSFLADEAEREKRLIIERTVDGIREKHGKNIMSLGTAAYARELGDAPKKEPPPFGALRFGMTEFGICEFGTSEFDMFE